VSSVGCASDMDISDSVVIFNDVPGSVASITLQSRLLHLVLAIVQLEHQLTVSRAESNVQVCRYFNGQFNFSIIKDCV
jgi:hypothetical protein